MVLWELTLTTAYFLGLKRTYRLALQIQRHLVGPKNPRIRNSLQRRTRTIFDVAVKFHQNVQQRDLEAGRNLGNWVLRWLDRVKSSAEKCSHCTNRGVINHIPSQISNYSHPAVSQKPYTKIVDRVSKGRLLFARWNPMAKYSPTIAMLMMRPIQRLGMSGQLRQLYYHSSPDRVVYNRLRRYEGVFRNDIALMMSRN